MSEVPTEAERQAPSRATLFRKLAEVMGEVGYVPKHGRNSFHNYDYVLEADLVEAIRPKLAERNVVIIPAYVASVEHEKGKDLITTVEMVFTICDGETGATFTAGWAGRGQDGGDKGLYKAFTGGEKYFLMKLFQVATGDDPEADAGVDQRNAEPAGRSVAKGADAHKGAQGPGKGNRTRGKGSKPATPQNAPERPTAASSEPSLDDIRALFGQAEWTPDELVLSLRSMGVDVLDGASVRDVMANLAAPQRVELAARLRRSIDGAP